jgi:hypothetical protein
LCASGSLNHIGSATSAAEWLQLFVHMLCVGWWRVMYYVSGPQQGHKVASHCSSHACFFIACGRATQRPSLAIGPSDTLSNHSPLTAAVNYFEAGARAQPAGSMQVPVRIDADVQHDGQCTARFLQVHIAHMISPESVIVTGLFASTTACSACRRDVV